MNKIITVILFIITLTEAQSNNDILLELQQFDNSLDSLIKDETYDYPKYSIYGEDTLFNNPTKIDVKYYSIYQEEPSKVEANSYILNFNNKQLTSFASEDTFGNKYVLKYVSFNDKIDNELILKNKKRETDTIIVCCLTKYDIQGRLIKKIIAYNLEVRNAYKLVKTCDYRKLEVYEYNDNESYYTTYCKEYSKENYTVDDLRNVKVFQNKTYLNKKNNDSYHYTKDVYGNWIIKKDTVVKYDTYTIVFRNIYYSDSKVENNNEIPARNMGKNIKLDELSNTISNYSDVNYIGAYGNNQMKPKQNGGLRDFGIYRKAKIRIKPTRYSNNEILVEGRLFVYGILKDDFKGKILITDIKRDYTIKKRLDERGNLIQDSSLINRINGKFYFSLKNKNEYNGSLSLSVKQDSLNKWSVEKSGVELYGVCNNTNLTFGHITPTSTGIFRVNHNNSFCINKNLLEYGWESYMYSYPEYFNCTFDSFSDEIYPINTTPELTKKNRDIEFNELE